MDVDVRFVDHSLKDLLSIQSEISKERDRLVRDGIPVMELAIDTAANAIVVGLDRATASGANRSSLVEQFGESIIVEPTSAGTDDACFVSGCMPTRGGIGMKSTVKENPCTIGFAVKIYQHPTLSTPRLGLLTAGHCFRLDGDSGYGVAWRHTLSDSSTLVGYAYEETFTEDASADAGIMTAHNTPTTKNLMVWRTTGVTKQIVGHVENAAQNQGDAICRIGVTSERDCDFITLLNKERWTVVSGYIRHLQHQNVYGVDSLGGDSGGPIFMYVGGTYGATAKAYGIHIHSKDPADAESWFSTYAWSGVQLSQEWGVIIGLCTDADC